MIVLEEWVPDSEKGNTVQMATSQMPRGPLN